MAHEYQLSDYEGATPYKFLTGMIENHNQDNRMEFSIRLFHRDNIDSFAGEESDIGDLMNFLYAMEYTTYPTIRRSRYFVRVVLHHEDGANSHWNIIPMCRSVGSITYDLLDILDNPYVLEDPLFADIIPRDAVNYHNRDGRLRDLLMKDWSNGEIQTLLHWAAKSKKVIAGDIWSYNNYESDWITLSLPPYPKSARK
jgi:hypothetical protein